MGNEPRISMQGFKVLNAFLGAYEANVGAELAGADVIRAAKVSSGTLYPLLMRFEEAGWLSSRWEEVPAQQLGRPRRRLYRLTGLGVGATRAAQEMLALPQRFFVAEGV